MRAVDANYGLADVLSIFAAECDENEGLHFLGQGAVLCELINPETGEAKQITDSEEGELVYTNLDKEGQPLVRYRSGDIVRIITLDKCACGRTGFRFKALTRTSDVLKVKGINIYLSAVYEIISSFSPELNGEFQIVLENPPPLERLLIKAELGKAARPDRVHLATDVAQTLKEKLGVYAEFQLLTNGTLRRYEGKAERIVRMYP
jgi:phenylacetate-CoA ligase